MKAHKLLSVGVSTALLAAVTLFGSACVVDAEDEPDLRAETAESDQEIVAPPAVDGDRDEGEITIAIDPLALDQADDESSAREESEDGPTIPGAEHIEPEPDPWTPGKPNPDDPME